jgi:hypothetical protein
MPKNTLVIGKFIRKNIFIILILGLSFFLRVYRLEELFGYGHDQDIASWFVRDVVVNKHLRLIGQETSTQGIFIGPLYYYLLIPFYLLFNMNPLGGEFLVITLGVVTTASIYFVFKKIHNPMVGLMGSFIYAVSTFMVLNDKQMIPTMTVFLWSVWFYYAINLVLKGNEKVFILLGILVSLVWHINFALILLTPLIPLAMYLAKKHFSLKAIMKGMFTLILTSLPVILFEIRHGFIEIYALFRSMTTNQYDTMTGLTKLERVIFIAAKNGSDIFWSQWQLNYRLFFILFLLTLIYFGKKKILTNAQSIICFSWILLYIIFFSLYSKQVSEYYLNGLIIIYILLPALLLTKLHKSFSKKIVYFLITLFFLVNVYTLSKTPAFDNGYLYKTALVKEIKKDAELNNYPCIAVSYITDRGYELGYRYLYWIEELKVNKPQEGIPVYSIVYPLKPVFKEDFGVGGLGLIYPDYNRYNKDDIKNNCAGKDQNITDPFWGLTI